MILVASCAFGLEAVVARELQALEFQTKISGPGQVQFEGDWMAVAKCNLWLRCADRVSVQIAEFDCEDFDALFETTKSQDWMQWLAPDAQVHVTGGSVKSKLTSVPAIQRTVKKAIVDSMLTKLGGETLPESGHRYRLHIAIRDDVARLSLDTTGPSLHKRGYREISTKAPLKETMASALVQLSFWKPGRPLLDPFCGGGTILIEAAMIGRNIAPGLQREFASEVWPQIPGDVWNEQREQARASQLDALPVRIAGTDIHSGALSLARLNAETAGVAADIHFQQRPFQELQSSQKFGCVVTNPPYGDRLDPVEINQLYESMPGVLKRLPTWSHFILTAYPQFEKRLGKQASRRRKLYNGRIECTYYQFHGPRPNAKRAADSPATDSPATDASEANAPVATVADDSIPSVPNSDSTENSDAQRPATPKRRERIAPVFGSINAKDREQADIFATRLRKRARHLRRWPTRRGITCYRLYERDIPEIPLVVDRYENNLHILEFERPHDRDLARHESWLELMAETAGKALEIPPSNVFMKTRARQKGLQQHEKLNNLGQESTVHEAGLKFLVNLTDYTDTGLFLDHRAARSMIRDISEGKRVLNLFAYTGAFSVYAAAGGAAEVTTVDWSSTYMDWAERNFAANEISGPQYRFIRQDTRQYVAKLEEHDEFDIVVCDPPTFSNSKRTDDVWDVQKDHAKLLNKLLLHLSADGTILFSSNFRRLKLDEAAITNASIQEITKRTLPEDFRNQRIHRSWFIRHAN